MGTLATRNKAKPTVKKPDNVFDCLNFFNSDLNWNSLEQVIDVHNWEDELNDKDSEERLSLVLKVTGEYCKTHVPEKTVFSSTKSKIPSHRVKLMRRRTRCNKHLQSPRSSIH